MTDNRNYIGGLEEIVLLAIQHGKEKAYGASIHRELDGVGREISIGSLYVTLARLEDKGYLKSRWGEATKKRGGKVKKHFALTGKGESALESAEYSRRRLRLRPQDAYIGLKT